MCSLRVRKGYYVVVGCKDSGGLDLVEDFVSRSQRLD